MPQDVEADDKLIGPFSFRQFVYLLIAAGFIAMAVGLFQIFPLLAIIPVLPTLLFLALALPLKKDQPMETYLAAIVAYYLKPRTRRWTAGQRESTILITAPKIVEDVRTRDLSQEEATHRLSFLADIVDSEGYAIKGAVNNNMREDLVAEANATTDMFENYNAMNLNRAVIQEKEERHAEAIREMRAAINRNEIFVGGGSLPLPDQQPGGQIVEQSMNQVQEKSATKPIKNSIMELANNSDFSIATIAKEANRINRKDEGEVFISLH